MKNAHKRIIWTCSWTKDEQYFATCSEDYSVRIFSLNLLKLEEMNK